jgi:hypothetical protein
MPDQQIRGTRRVRGGGAGRRRSGWGSGRRDCARVGYSYLASWDGAGLTFAIAAVIARCVELYPDCDGGGIGREWIEVGVATDDSIARWEVGRTTMQTLNDLEVPKVALHTQEAVPT